MAAGEAPAVWVKGAYKYYGREKDPNKKIVLNYLNMSVQKGSIYGLLGASGCGKTTLLSCVVGRKSLHAGQVRVLGSEPGHATACRIGYMPQDVALVGEFSVRDAVYFFGRIHGLSESQISSRMAFLMDLLELPCEDRLVKNLSGGQQRRVSFAAALVHEPELLILDEPTVGLDPVLRDRIWNYMVDLADNKNVAVVITTHYIEETKQAHTIGLMRGGELLAEESPSSLMRRLNTSTLEDAFLALSIKQSRAEGSREEPVIIDTGGPSRHDDVITEKGNITNHYDSKDDFSKMYCGSQDVLTQEEDKKAKTKDLGGSSYRYKALFLKNMQQFARQPEGLIFSIFFPIIQMMAFLIAVGHEPRELHLGIVNHEVPNWSDCLKDNSSFPSAVFDPEEYSCKFNKLSCRYIKSLDDDIIKKKFFVDKESAFRAVEAGEVMGALVIPGNFSSSTADRLELGRDTDLGTVESSIAKYWMDMSNHQIAHFFQKKLYDDFSEFSRSLMADCQLPTNLATMPMRFHDPIYGKNDSSFTAFMIPGIMVTILFFLPTLVTSTLMISDRLEGFWDRSIVAGVRSTEILSVHICIHTVVALFQTFELMALSFLVYSFPVAGDMVTVALLMFLQGVCGMCFGFLISVLCNSYVTSSYITTGSFYPMILLCGILWPIEGMNSYIRVLSYLMPFTVPIRSLRNVMEKGWDIANVEVYNGFLVTFAWIIALIILCYAVLRIKKS